MRKEVIGDATLYLGDCMDVLPTLSAVDHVITDPPYAPRAMHNARSHKNITHRRDGKHYEFGYGAIDSKLRSGAGGAITRLAARWIVVWCDIESAGDWRAALDGSDYIRTGVWVRTNSAPQFSGDRPAQGVEACVIAHGEAKKRWNGRGRAATWTGPIVNSASGERQHSSPKPLWLMEGQIDLFTDAGEVVIDPFMGSGTTGVACLGQGRRFIGIEIDETYFDIACERIDQAQRQERLFI